jgi:uncharacterized protein
MKMLKTLSAACAFLLAGPALAQSSVPADPALWVVKDKDTTIYLFGTVHALKPHLSWFDSAVRKAFDASQQLVLEIPLPDPATAQKVILPLAMDHSGKPLTQKLPEASRAAYAAALTKLGVPPAGLDAFEPWFAAVTIAQIQLKNSGMNAEDGVEKTLDAAAKAAGKPVSGLETLEQQLGYFHNLPEKDQIAFLIESVKDIDKFDTTINAMVDKWKAGDAEGLSKLMNEDLTAQANLYKTLLVDRNARWADWIDARMKQPGTVFIAVGAGHLAGKDSVQVQLRRHHLKAVRIKY